MFDLAKLIKNFFARRPTAQNKHNDKNQGKLIILPDLTGFYQKLKRQKNWHFSTCLFKQNVFKQNYFKLSKKQ